MWITSITNFLLHFLFSIRNSIKKHIEKLGNKAFRALSNSFLEIIVSDASIENHIAMLILHIYSFNKPVIKTIHRAVNVITTEAKLFAI